MSNFICSECGMTNIDCGYAGYKTPKEIELEHQIANLSKKVEHLQDENKKLKERIKDANEIVDDVYNYQCATCARIGGCMSCGNRYAGKYMKKWGVK